MELHWIGIREASALTQRPERTLRYQAAQGKIQGKKEGSAWLIELNSLKKAGLIKLHLGAPPPDQPHKNIPETAKPEPVKGESSKSPHDLASYRALIAWRMDATHICPSCLPLSTEILKSMSAGYFEYARERKAEFYCHARELLAYLWVDLEFLKTPENSAAVHALSTRLCSEVIPALSGALRKVEGKPPQNRKQA